MFRKPGVRGFFLGLLVSAVCLAVLLHNVELAQSGHALGRIRPTYLFLPLVISLLALALRGWRWQQIFPRASRPRLLPSLEVLAIGNLANNLLPGRAGDLSRCVLIGRKTSVAQSSLALATLGVEKIFDGLALVVVVLFAAWVLSPPRWVWRMAELAALVLVSAMLVLVLLRHRTGVFRSMAQGIGGPRTEQTLEAFVEGLHVLGSAAHSVALGAMTVAIWVTEAALVWAIALAMDAPISPAAAVVVAALLGLGFMIPAAPAGVGTYELFGVAAFQLVGVASASALAITVVIHAWVFATNNVLGLVGLASAGIGWSQLRTASQSADQPAPGTAAVNCPEEPMLQSHDARQTRDARPDDPTSSSAPAPR